MRSQRVFYESELVNGSAGDPVLYIDYPDRDNALLFDTGENHRLPMEKLADLTAVFISHHHVDHFIGLDRIIRANIDSDKVLSIFGPTGTIQKVYDRIVSYEYQYFPFQRIVVEVNELLPGETDGRFLGRRAKLECRRRFPKPKIEEYEIKQGVIFEGAETRVEAARADHVIPCLAYAMVERPGFHLREDKLERGLLKPGLWTTEVLRALSAGDVDPKQRINIQGGSFSVAELGKQYFKRTRGVRVAFVTDTTMADHVSAGLLRLARGAYQLYCDSFYLEKDAARAEKFRHLTAAGAARFAAQAGVDQLVQMHYSQRYRGQFQALLDEAREVFPNTITIGMD